MTSLSLFISVMAFTLFSCDKGYEARFTNYYSESMDSVVVGASGAVFAGIGIKQSSDYQHVKSGTHSVVFKTHSGLKFYGTFPVPTSGTGKYTIQVDGVRQVSILED
jgi:hypothetical protein